MFMDKRGSENAPSKVNEQSAESVANSKLAIDIDSLFTKEDIATFKASAHLISPGAPTIDMKTLLTPMSQFTTPISEEDWKKYRKMFFGEVKAREGEAHKGVKEKRAASTPLNSNDAPLKPLMTKNPVIEDNYKIKMTEVRIKAGTFLIPSQKCLKREDRRVSSFSDHEGKKIASAGLLAGIAAIKRAKEKEERKAKKEVKVQRHALSGKVLDEKKVYKQKPKAKARLSEPPRTPPRRITVTVPMAPYKKYTLPEQYEPS